MRGAGNNDNGGAPARHMKLIIFDCDGTLVDSQHNIARAMRMAFEAHGVPFPGERAVREVIGLSLPEAVAPLAPGASPEMVNRLSDAYREAFFALRHDPDFHEPLFPGARQAIMELHSRPDVLLGIATGKARRGLDALLERFSLGHCFATTQTADDAPSKPHPEMVLRALDETGLGPRDAVLVGDTTHDMQMAANAGIGAIGVAWGYHPPERQRAAGALHIAETFDEIPTLAVERLQADITNA